MPSGEEREPVVAQELEAQLAHPLQLAFNVFLFAIFGAVAAHETYVVWREGRLDFVEVSFAVQNAIMVALVLLRRPHRAVERDPFRQAIAIAAFLSGALFMGEPATSSEGARLASKIVVLASNVLGLLTLLNLGRSFGILIALRKVETRFLYSVVRHPMYGTDILLRIGFLVSHLSPFTAALFVLSTGCYVLRALSEERFLSSDPAYREYMQRVRWRFIPGLC